MLAILKKQNSTISSSDKKKTGIVHESIYTDHTTSTKKDFGLKALKLCMFHFLM